MILTERENVYSSTHERKSKTAIFVKNGKIYLKHNSIAEDIPVVIFMKVKRKKNKEVTLAIFFFSSLLFARRKV